MPAKIKFFITNPKGKTASGKKVDEVNILVRFTNGRMFDIIAKTNKQIKSVYWNNDSGIVRDVAAFQNKGDLQKHLNSLERFVLEEYDKTSDKSEITKGWLDKTIDKHSNPGKYLQSNTLFGFIQHHFIDNGEKRINTNTGNPVTYKMRREYQVTFDYLKKFSAVYREPDFKDIDLDFYNNFVDFLRNCVIERKDGTAIPLAQNTIGKKIQTLKIFLNTATEQGINVSQKYKTRSFRQPSEESENIYLTKKELKKFYEYDLSERPGLEKVRDVFIIGAWTGLRYADLEQITPDKIKGEFIFLKQKKTGGKVVIPVHYTVKEILNKYNGQLPKIISNQKFNQFLKEAAQMAEIDGTFIKTTSVKGMKVEKKYKKYELISSHTARRSFATNAYDDGIPSLSIMAITGHKTEKAFLKYIKLDEQKHARKVLEMWQKKGEFLKVAK